MNITIKSEKPSYNADKLKIITKGKKLRGRLGTIRQPAYKLSIAREGFIYRCASIFNKLDDDLRNEVKIYKFKAGLRKWVLQKIAIKPVLRYPTLTAEQVAQLQPQPHQPAPENDIRRYFQPVTCK